MRHSHRRKKAVPTTIGGVLVVLIGLALAQWKKHAAQPAPPASTNILSVQGTPTLDFPRRTPAVVGWTSRASLQSHYQKHGREFGGISMDEYLRKAQAFRDGQKGGPVLEIVRSDRVITRFNRLSGEFIAFNPDHTIRTYFVPDAGEKYFQRQAERLNEDE